MKIHEIIKLSSAFSAEVNVARDYRYQLQERDQKIDGYLPNASSRSILKSILETLGNRDERKLHLITASYGTGKSYLLLMLAHLLGNNKEEILKEFNQKIFDKEDFYKDELGTCLQSYFTQEDPFLVVIPKYDDSDFNHSLLEALNIALIKEGINYIPYTNYRKAKEAIEEWRENNLDLFKNFEKNLTNCDIEQFLHLLDIRDTSAYSKFKKIFKKLIRVDFSETHADRAYPAFEETAKEIAGQGYKGIVILHDEFGHTLSTLINSSSTQASFKVQNFLEEVNDRKTNANILFIAASHQEPTSLQENKEKDLNKVIGRFSTYNLEVSESESEEIIGTVFIKKDPDTILNLTTPEFTNSQFLQIEEHNLYEGKKEEWIRERIIKNLYPLHPLTSYILPRLSGQFAQNTRSMFNFLSPSERKEGALHFFLQENEVRHSNGDINLYNPDMLLGFFMTNLKESRSDVISSIIDSFEMTLGKIKEPEVIRLLRNILILTVANREQIRPRFDALFWAMGWSDAKKQDLKYLLKDLVHQEVLEYNPTEEVYEFPAFGSKSLSKIIDEEKKKISLLNLQECSRIWEDLEPRGFFESNEQFEKYGANRVFQYIATSQDYEIERKIQDLLKYYSWEGEEYFASGLIFYLIGSNKDEINNLKESVTKKKEALPYIIYSTPKNQYLFDPIVERTVHYQGLLEVSKRADVASSESRRESIKTQITVAHAELVSAIKDIYQPKEWNWFISDSSNAEEIKSSRLFESWLEKRLEDLFSIVPVIKDDALWFIQGSKRKSHRSKALAKILTAENNRIPLVNNSSKSHAVEDRIVENLFKNIKITRDTEANNKIQYGEIKLPEPGTPAEEIWDHFEKVLKVGAVIAPVEIVKPLLIAPFGLSEHIIKLLFVCYIRYNKEFIRISDAKRPLNVFDKSPDLFDNIFNKPKDFSLRKIPISGPDIRFLNNLNKLFLKDNDASSFGELSKRFEGLLSLMTPLQRALIKEDGSEEIKKIYHFLETIKEDLNKSGIDKDKEALNYFTETLPSILLDISSKEEFENDPENIKRIFNKIKTFKEFPSEAEAKIKLKVLKLLSREVFKKEIVEKDDFRQITKEWFSSLPEANRIASYENEYVNDWIKSLSSGINEDLYSVYLDKLSENPISNWSDLSYETSRYIQRFADYKRDVEAYTRNPLEVYQSIAQEAFEVSQKECSTEVEFSSLFNAWWKNLSPIKKKNHYKDTATNIFLKSFDTSFSTKEKYLINIPIQWKDNGTLNLINTQWESWEKGEIKVVSEQYKRCIEIVNHWKPPIKEDFFFESVGELFGVKEAKDVDQLQESLKENWFHKLPFRTQNAVWPIGSEERAFLAGLKESTLYQVLVEELATQWNLEEFTNWNNDTLQEFKNKLILVRDRIEGYRRPVLEIIKDLEKKKKSKSENITAFRSTLKDTIRETEAYKNSIDRNQDLLNDSTAKLFVASARSLSSDHEINELFTSLAQRLNMNPDNHLWSEDEQTQFVQEINRGLKLIKTWKYPVDLLMEDAKKEIFSQVKNVQTNFNLSKHQLIKVMRDILDENLH